MFEIIDDKLTTDPQIEAEKSEEIMESKKSEETTSNCQSDIQISPMDSDDTELTVSSDSNSSQSENELEDVPKKDENKTKVEEKKMAGSVRLLPSSLTNDLNKRISLVGFLNSSNLI